MQDQKDLALIDAKELSLVENNALNPEQLARVLGSTPKQYIHRRPAKGGGTWEYVTGGYIRKVLNLAFGWRWDFEVLESTVAYGEVVILGRLTCTTEAGDKIIKTQYGNKEIITRKGSDQPLSIGNDYKAATTDALKKCAAEIGIAADIYNAKDFREIKIDTESKEEQIEGQLS